MEIRMIIGIAVAIAILFYLTRQANRGSQRARDIRDAGVVGTGVAAGLWALQGLWRLFLAAAWGVAMYAFSIFLIRDAPDSARLVIGFIGFLIALTFGWRASRP